MKKRIFALLVAAAMMAPMLILAGCDTRETINVYNWGEYISNGDDGSLDVNAEFTRRTGIRVNYTTYDTNEDMYQKIKNGAADYDIIIPSDYMIEKMVNEGMLERLDFSNIPNVQYIGDEYKNLPFDPGGLYSVAYAWGTVGIIYNKTMVDAADVAEQSWSILWNEKYAGDILMFSPKNPRDNFGVALKMLGYSQNSLNPGEWLEAAAALSAQKPLVQAYVMDEVFGKMEGDNAALAVYYAGDAYTMMESNPNLGFFIPKEGSNHFVDAICIPMGSKNKSAAEKYIDFLCDPEIALANIEYINYSTPNTAAYDELDEEVKSDPNFYPPASVLDRCDIFHDLSLEIYTLQNELWTEIMTQSA